MSHAPKPAGEEPNPPVKRRRGRQPRPSLLNDRVKAAVATFALGVGKPRVIEPAGFRDFRGWLAFIGGPTAIIHWLPLVEAVALDCNKDLRVIHSIKPDLVREIVKAVVVPRAGESSKLVSTNCGRQCARPSSGVTLMTILDKVFSNLQQWADVRANQSYASPAYVTHNHRSDPHSVVARRASPSSNARYQSSLPPVNRLLPEHRSRNGAHASASSASHGTNSSRHEHHDYSRRSQGSLPSFRELEDSLQSPLNLGKRGRG